jgi:hypothetical protein
MQIASRLAPHHSETRHPLELQDKSVSAAPVLFGLPLHCWPGRILDLEPMRETAQAIARPQELRHDALTAKPAGSAIDDCAFLLVTLVENETGLRAAQ